MIKIRYFAWVQQQIGMAEEMIDPPPSLKNVGELMAWLAGKSDDHAKAFANPSQIKIAINQHYCEPSHSLASAKEIAFFPPVTGG